MPNTNTFLLNKKIDDSGLKKKSIAKRVALSPQGLDNKINAKREFKANEITEISKALNLSHEEIISIFLADLVDEKSTDITA